MELLGEERSLKKEQSKPNTLKESCFLILIFTRLIIFCIVISELSKEESKRRLFCNWKKSRIERLARNVKTRVLYKKGKKEFIKQLLNLFFNTTLKRRKKLVF